MGNFYTDVIRKDARFGSLQPIHDLALLEPVTRSKVLAIIADAAAAGIKLMAYETFRSQARQTKLYHQRATKLKTVGVHHYGLACDLVKDIAGEPSWKGDFAFLGRLAKKHRMIWGGDWGSPGARHKFVDSVHVQRCAIPRQKALFAGIWYPGEDYDPYARRAGRREPTYPFIDYFMVTSSGSAMAEDSGAFQEFWHHYLHEHAHVGTRALHYAGTIIGLFGVTIAALTLTLGPALTGIVIAYLLAWAGHFFIERNRPCAFTHPLWSFVSNMRMLRCWITGDLDLELRSSGVPTE